MDEDFRTILSELGLRSCSGVWQKLTKMIANVTDEHVQAHQRQGQAPR